MNKVSSIIERNKKQFLLCLVSTFILGLIAHCYMFLNNSISHDSLNEFIANESVFIGKMQLGRIFWLIPKFISGGSVTLPWLVGVFSLLYISIAVFLVVKIFDVKSKFVTIVISGIFTVNITVIAIVATYMHDMDADILAMLLAVVSVFLWKKYRYGWLLGIVFLTGTFGLYQSYISVTITLILFSLILELLKGNRAKAIFISGLKAICMIICAGILYYISMKIVLSIYDVTIVSGSYNSIDTILSLSFEEIINIAIIAYMKTLMIIFYPISIFNQEYYSMFMGL